MSELIKNGARKLKQNVSPYIKNFGGWTTSRKIIVIESDDWGSIRMPSRKIYEKCLRAGFRVDQNPYERYDSLASENDLENLFELLGSFRDKTTKPPIITANVLTTNPDFEKIEQSDFQEYHYELIDKTFDRYPEHSNALKIWKEGMANQFFFPQSHGREHLNVSLFMSELKKGNEDLHFAFNHKIPGSLRRYVENSRNLYVVSLDYMDSADKREKLEIIKDGLIRFEEIFGFKSKTFMPPNYYWPIEYDQEIAACSVEFYQGNRKMVDPNAEGKPIIHKRKLGQRNKFGQLYLIRNCTFEPSLFRKKINDPVDRCMRDIEISFFMKKPAVISTHRLNFVGYINQKNRDKNLKLFSELLSRMLKKWPEIEFLRSDQLGEIISSEVKQY